MRPEPSTKTKQPVTQATWRLDHVMVTEDWSNLGPFLAL